MVLGLDLEALLSVIAGASIGSTLYSTWRNRHTVEDMKVLLVEMRAKEIEKIKVAVAPPGGFIPPAPVRRSAARAVPSRRLPPVVGPPPRVPRPAVREPVYEEPPPPPPPVPEPEVQRPLSPARRIIQEEETIRRRRIEESESGQAPPEPPSAREVVDLEPEPPVPQAAAGAEQVSVLRRPEGGPRDRRPPAAPPTPVPAGAPLVPARPEEGRASDAVGRPPGAPLRGAPAAKRGLLSRAREPLSSARAEPVIPVPLPPPDPKARQQLLASRRGLSEILEDQARKGMITRRTFDYLMAKAPRQEGPSGAGSASQPSAAPFRGAAARPPMVPVGASLRGAAAGSASQPPGASPDAKRVEALLAALEAQRRAGALSEETYQRSRAQLLKQLGQTP